MSAAAKRFRVLSGLVGCRSLTWGGCSAGSFTPPDGGAVSTAVSTGGQAMAPTTGGTVGSGGAPVPAPGGAIGTGTAGATAFTGGTPAAEASGNEQGGQGQLDGGPRAA